MQVGLLRAALQLKLDSPSYEQQAWSDVKQKPAQPPQSAPLKQAAQPSAANLPALQETIGEVKMLRDEALQAQADAERKLARCEKQLREATDQLRSAQEVG